MKRKWIFICMAFIMGLCGCQTAPHSTTEFFAMDTVMQITLYENNDQLLSLAKEQVVHLENALSVTKPNSEIYKINQSRGQTVSVSQDTADLLQTAKELHSQTNGAFDVTVYPAVKAWGFTQNANRIPTVDELENILPYIDSNKLTLQGTSVTLPKGMEVDLGGIAKGYAADNVAQLLLEKGCSGGVLSFGGNVKTFGSKPNGTLFQIAVQDPHDAAKTVGALAVAGNIAVVTSGDSQRYFEQNGVKYHHIIHPKTAAPAKSDLSSVTVVCSSATRADAFATALYIMGLEAGLAFANQSDELEALFIEKNGTIHLTNGLQTAFTPQNA